MGRLYRGHQCIVSEAGAAFSWWARLRGLLFRNPLAADGSEALMLRPCGSVHTFGMRYSLDVVFLSTDERVLKVCENVRPWRVRVVPGAHSTLELKSGAASLLGIEVGDMLRWQEQ